MHYAVGLPYEGFSSAARARQGFSEVLCQILGDLAGLGVNAGIKAILGAVGFVGDHHDVAMAGGHGERSQDRGKPSCRRHFYFLNPLIIA